MRKNVIIGGLGLMLVGAAGIASAQSTQPRRQEHQRAGQGQAEGRRGGPGGGMGALLRGITLTDAQKAKLAELRKADRAQANGQANGQGNANRGQVKRDRAQMQKVREQRFAEVRSILTPDQQKQFDANVAQLKSRASRFE
jgi:Spy/CpxP family protein refolding chaperone